MAASAYFSQIQQAYLAYYGRPADPNGLQYWADQLDKASGNLSVIINAFGTSAESTALYAGSSTAAQVNSIYQTLFGRDADLAGLNFYVQGIQSGKFSLASVALNIYNGATGTDKTALDNKLIYANAFTNDINTTAAVLGYSGTAAANAARAAVAQVHDAASLATATTGLDATVAGVTSAGTVGQTYTLTNGVDNIILTGNNSVVNGVVAGNSGSTTSTGTFTPLDKISGTGTGNTLNISDLSGAGVPSGVSVSGVQTLNWVSAGNANVNTTPGFTGLKTANVTSSAFASVTVGNGTAANVTAATGASVIATDSAVTVVNAKGFVTINGGSTQTVTTAGGVNLYNATGAVTATDSAQGAANSSIKDGTSASLTTSVALDGTAVTGANLAANHATNSTVTIGAAGHLPTGAVTVVENVVGDKANNATAGDITINGGTTVSVTSNATQATAAANGVGTNYTVTQAAVTVNGSSATTSVSVTQTAAVAEVDGVAVKAGVNLADNVTFGAMAKGDTVTVDGLTFTANAALTATQAAAAFANLAAGATQGNSTLGTYSGALSKNFSSGTNSAGVVTFTATKADSTSVDVVTGATGSASATAVQTAAGVTAVTAVAGVGGIANGAVNVQDAKYGTTTANTITSVSENGYASGFVKSDALATLSLANSKGQTVSVYDNTAKTLGLTVNNLGAASALNLDAANAAGTYTALNITTAGKDSLLNVTGAAVQALTVSGTNALDLSSSTFSALKTVTVSGAAGVTLDASGATVTDFNASASSGHNVAKIDASKATYEGGSGGDTVTLTSATVSKAVTMGAGNDTVKLASGTTAVAATIDGGAGTNTLSMDAADAVTASGSSLFATKVVNFQVLNLNAGAGLQTVHVDTLGHFNSVVTGGEAAAGVLTLDGFTSGGSLTLNAAAAGSYVVSSAAFATPTNDVFNINVSNAAGINAGSVTVNKVETINLTSTDTTATHAAGTNTNILALSADSVTSIKVTGNANLTLDGHTNTTVTSVDASGLTGGLTYTAAGTVAETIKGGAGANHLTAAVGGTTADVLIGGAGNDVLTANAGLDTLTGGGGNNTFVIQTASTNVNTYATITDAHAGDTVQFLTTGTVSFVQSKVALASTAVFQDYANAAVASAATGQGNIAWFQFGGDTYVIQNQTGAETAFHNGTDLIVKLTGAVDLSHASLSTDHGSLLLG